MLSNYVRSYFRSFFLFLYPGAQMFKQLKQKVWIFQGEKTLSPSRRRIGRVGGGLQQIRFQNFEPDLIHFMKLSLISYCRQTEPNPYDDDGLFCTLNVPRSFDASTPYLHCSHGVDKLTFPSHSRSWNFIFLVSTQISFEANLLRWLDKENFKFHLGTWTT